MPPNPKLSVFKKIEELEKNMASLVQQAVNKAVSERMDTFQDKDIMNAGFVEKLIAKGVDEAMRKYITESKGDKGDPGYTPQRGVDYLSDKELAQIGQDIESRIRIPADGIDGRDGFDADEEGIIQRVMTQVKGMIPKPETVDTNAIIESVAARIPKPKDGKDAAPVPIQELKDEIEKVKRELIRVAQSGGGGGGGGGMGQPTHEVFSVSSATTSITLQSRVAFNGAAIFKFAYQGQELHQGVHYTSPGSTKVVPLLFTPDDGFIEVIYIRA